MAVKVVSSLKMRRNNWKICNLNQTSVKSEQQEEENHVSIFNGFHTPSDWKSNQLYKKNCFTPDIIEQYQNR